MFFHQFVEKISAGIVVFNKFILHLHSYYNHNEPVKGKRR